MVDQETLHLFDELYYSTYESVLTYVVCNCSNIENVKDIVQNIYLEVLKKLEKEKTFLINKAYIMGIAKNKVRDYYRFRYKNKLVSLFSFMDSKEDICLLDTVSSDIDIESDLIKEEDIQFIWAYLKKKKVVIAKIFYLYYYMDFEIKEIAEKVHMSESNVKNYLYRTLKELNVFMKKRGERNE